MGFFIEFSQFNSRHGLWGGCAFQPSERLTGRIKNIKKQNPNHRVCGYSNKSFAGYFHRDLVAMSRGIAKVEGRARSDKDFGVKLRRLERVITLGQKRKI